ncbi:MarR family transcriptional regulator [Halobacteriales archaeon QS_1_68_20]|nr:MAG: MarR family transcriptional regulator [Halobacteriales archaeon QS_1_68_20]
MDSAALLDLLGNENRRRILRLLARKPCYVTEISEYLGVSPKAVIDHLRKLEEAGLVESRTDQNRRKYFHIARNVRLEVHVSPYEFGAKSAYAASPNLDIKTCRYLSVEISDADSSQTTELAAELDRLQELENELSLAQRWAQGRLTEVLDQLSESLGTDGDGRLYAEILATVAADSYTPQEVSSRVDAPPAVVEEALDTLADQGVVREDDDGWVIVD